MEPLRALRLCILLTALTLVAGWWLTLHDIKIVQTQYPETVANQKTTFKLIEVVEVTPANQVHPDEGTIAYPVKF